MRNAELIPRKARGWRLTGCLSRGTRYFDSPVSDPFLHAAPRTEYTTAAPTTGAASWTVTGPPRQYSRTASASQSIHELSCRSELLSSAAASLSRRELRLFPGPARESLHLAYLSFIVSSSRYLFLASFSSSSPRRVYFYLRFSSPPPCQDMR